MYKILFLIIGILVAAFIQYRRDYIFSQEEILHQLQQQSNERIQKLHLDKGSEDVSHILDQSRLTIHLIKQDTGLKNYQPNPDLCWIINLNITGGGTFEKSGLSKIFNQKDWIEHYPSEISGYSPEEQKWTNVMSADAPARFEKIQVSIDLLEVFYTDKPDFAPENLTRYVRELERKIAFNSANLSVQPTEPVDEAIKKSKKLVALHQEFDQIASIQLKSDTQFEGTLVWDALMSLGLEWGDGDLFYWNNENSMYGFGKHFSVRTTTKPGYFLPEKIVAGEMNPGDLMFDFSVPQSVDPEHVFDVMVNAAQYCQKRLGGQLLDTSGQPFNAAQQKKHIIVLVEKMKSKGMVPGSEKALKMY